MAARLALALVVAVAMVFAVQAAEPEPFGDYQLPAPGTPVTSDYFYSSEYRGSPVVAAGAKLGVKRLNAANFPVLTGLAVSSAQLKFLPGGINPPHSHPRGTELLLVTEGCLTVGLVDTANKFYTKTLFAGDVFVFPKGLVHYQINLSNKHAVAYVAFSSSNPGTVSIPVTLFGTGIPDNVHVAAFKVKDDVVKKLKWQFNV